MEKNIRVYHETEERYARLVILYSKKIYIKKIENEISKATKKYLVVPITYNICSSNSENGEYSIEFHDDYDRKSSDFFSEVMNGIGVKQCEIG